MGQAPVTRMTDVGSAIITFTLMRQQHPPEMSLEPKDTSYVWHTTYPIVSLSLPLYGMTRADPASSA